MNCQKLPNWNELPDLDLYLDQVLIYVNQLTQLDIKFAQKELTASMINNYVKHGYLAKPQKKKYQKEQIGRLIAISILKNAFPIQTITSILEQLKREQSSELIYNSFVNYWNDSQIDNCPEIVITACQTIKHYYKTLSIVSTIQVIEEDK